MLPPIQQQIRKTIRQQRRQLSSSQQCDAANKLTFVLQQHPRIQQASNIAIFLSFDGEIDTQPLIQQLWQTGKQVCLPVLHPFNRHQLLFLTYRSDTAMQRNRLGIQQPELTVSGVIPLQQLDVILTPLVAFDNNGHRLGMGGGYYDRLLAQWQNKTFYPIGLAHTMQYVEQLPVEPWDIPLPEIITPDKTWYWPENDRP